ncbi:MAG: hypothetical protein HY544_03935 [Candidatus Diapherotrites archaeon]|uniref:Uncharacterized protein n=1 Tax=Candidatus Iainarchaeum sp. TaxID=3101447 RepID=A0A8T3YNN8_9ARCH|nr:hypothetical protein [Candidatus Diapherotrites archaeon]
MVFRVARFTPDQKRIAVLLLHAPKTAEELNRQLGIPFDELNESLKHMVRLKLLRLEGYPQRYHLADAVVDAVKRRKEIQEKDPFDLRLKATLEAKGVEEAFLRKQMAGIEAGLRKEKNFTVYDVIRAEPIKDGSHYTAYLDVNLSIKDFSSIVRFMYFYGPTSVEVLKPAKITIPMDDLQDALMEMADMIQAYNNEMLKSMAKDELASFSKSLYSPKG